MTIIYEDNKEHQGAFLAVPVEAPFKNQFGLYRPSYTLLFKRVGDRWIFEKVIRQIITLGADGRVLDVREEA
jgi:hypothetical protein